VYWCIIRPQCGYKQPRAPCIRTNGTSVVPWDSMLAKAVENEGKKKETRLKTIPHSLRRHRGSSYSLPVVQEQQMLAGATIRGIRHDPPPAQPVDHPQRAQVRSVSRTPSCGTRAARQSSPRYCGAAQGYRGPVTSNHQHCNHMYNTNHFPFGILNLHSSSPPPPPPSAPQTRPPSAQSPPSSPHSGAHHPD